MNELSSPHSPLRLTGLVALIEQVMSLHFEQMTFWVTAEVTDVKQYPEKGWCFLKLIEKKGSEVVAKLDGVLWRRTFGQIAQFEQTTGRRFASGMELLMLVRLNYSGKYGLTAELLQIDTAYTLGKIEQDRQEVLRRLLADLPAHVRLIQGEYITANRQLPAPVVIQRIALIAPPHSDGRNDFLHELGHNPYGYTFVVHEYLCQVQGQGAASQLLNRLADILESAQAYDAVVIVRGGGSQTDFGPFDTYELARAVALYPLPVFTGIGHERNVSICDLMAHAPLKTPTKVAAEIIGRQMQFEEQMLALRTRVFRQATAALAQARRNLALRQQALIRGVHTTLERRKWQLDRQKQALRYLHPDHILARGFAMLYQDGRLIKSVAALQHDLPLRIRLRDGEVEVPPPPKPRQRRKA